PLPWPTGPASGVPNPLALPAAEWLTALWTAFATAARALHPGATHYAEKAPSWLPAAARAALPCRAIYVARDPRDVYLSADAFNRARGWLSFGRRSGDSDLDYARTLAHRLLDCCADRRAAATQAHP